MSGNTITVNGKTYKDIQGNNISVVNGVIKVDGKVICEGLSGDVHVKWEGDLANLETHNADILGSVKGSVKGHNIDIEGFVGGDVTGHNIDCGDVNGNVQGRNVSHG